MLLKVNVGKRSRLPRKYCSPGYSQLLALCIRLFLNARIIRPYFLTTKRENNSNRLVQRSLCQVYR